MCVAVNSKGQIRGVCTLGSGSIPAVSLFECIEVRSFLVCLVSSV